jgi:hypothetical protein
MTIRSRSHQVTRGLLALTAACIGVVAFAGPAQAVTAKGLTTDVRIHIHKPTQSAELWTRSLGGKSVTTLIDAGAAVVYAQGGATGDGPADDAECNGRAAAISALNFGIEAALLADDPGLAADLSSEASQQIEDALDAGCFIVWKERPEEPPIG